VGISVICSCQLISVQVAIKTIMTPLRLTDTHPHRHRKRETENGENAILWTAINSLLSQQPFNNNKIAKMAEMAEIHANNSITRPCCQTAGGDLSTLRSLLIKIPFSGLLAAPLITNIESN